MIISSVSPYKYNNYQTVSKRKNSAQNTFKGYISYDSFSIYNKQILTKGNFLSRNQKLINNIPTKAYEDLLYILEKLETKNIAKYIGIVKYLNGKNTDLSPLRYLVDRLENEGIDFNKLSSLIDVRQNNTEESNKIDLESINKLLDFRLEAIENKHLLDKHNRKATVNDINDIVLEKPQATFKVLNLLGSNAFIYSFKEKKIML